MAGMLQPNMAMPRSNWNQPTMNQGSMGMMGNMNYQNPSPQLPTASPANFRPSLFGRLVGSVEEITVQDVPTDGSASFFPLGDYSCIYAKQWGSNGLIQTVKYVPEKIEDPSPIVDENLGSAIMERLSSIEEMLKKQPHTYRPYKKDGYRKQKEVETNDGNA